MVRFLYGLILGVGGLRLIYWIREAGLEISWLVWGLAVIALIMATLAVQHFFASYREFERRAAWVGLGILGIQAGICAFVAVWLLAA